MVFPWGRRKPTEKILIICLKCKKISDSSGLWQLRLAQVSPKITKRDLFFSSGERAIIFSLALRYHSLILLTQISFVKKIKVDSANILPRKVLLSRHIS